MAKFKAKAVVDGQEREVELDDTVVITVDQHNLRLKDSVQRRLARQAMNLKDELLKDDAFVATVLKAKGVDPEKLTVTGGKDVDVAKLQEELRRAEVQPLTEKLSKEQEKTQRILRRQLVSELTTDLVNAGVAKSVAPRIAELEANRFGFDEQSERWALKDGESFRYAPTASKEAPYFGTSDFAKEWAGDKNNAPFLDRTTAPDGPGIGAPRTGGAGGGAPLPEGTKRSALTDEQRVAFISENGLDKFMALPA